jgi:hypothetical protein
MSELKFIEKELKQVENFCLCEECTFTRGDERCKATLRIKKFNLTATADGCGTIKE